MTELEIPFDVATALLSIVNLNAKESLGGIEEYVYEGKPYKFSTILLRDKIREGLDGICETIEECRQSFTGKNLEAFCSLRCYLRRRRRLLLSLPCLKNFDY